MAPGMWQILLVVLLAAVLFGGRGKIAAVMGDFAKGITSFRKGLKDDEDETASDAEDTSAIRDESRDDEKTGS
ncbi:MAG: twin-arginine translocase TatA/TatE family subunit [Maricaulis sp.]|uniref:twin-arginine translocase TatA/TatE family subunit n=1 Tax=Maricaulis sp. TaxID=1486257 RepID=UPI001B150457|nr:twin-arginine translocase TatA/TatE family subunit [Maricaulis sp.]MBO6728645.1 twin-arginine translocase TatA/TatE family subunit [Maricaulis sp.]MBO6848227.1 twin-arginine translocase TatA/TatE family subunit [Maricaulis sp.]MBO6877952.1 twin-arginine translocase TatA/TatE family subunit [Maricaulis sp.]MDM7983332.1 twin-arginine translocase TatA/TatE family subunit [Maricaulis sp.]